MGFGARAVGRQKEQRKTWVAGEPLFNGFRLMDVIVIDHHGELCVLRGGITRSADPEEVPEPRVGFAGPQAVEQSSGGQSERPWPGSVSHVAPAS